MALLLASGGHDQDDAGLARERDRRGADAASSSMDERGLAGGERAEAGHEEVREGGEESLRKSRRLLVAHPLRNGQHRPIVDDHLLRVPATGEERHDALAPREAARRGAALDDRPGALEAENRRGSGGWRVETLALEEIGAVHGCGGDSDADVFGAERRRGRLAGYEDVLVARFADQDGAHVAAHHDRGWRVNGTLAPA